tara:strand:+ start:1987 stop:2493 length:507 start_codon:yes stop_codon:yes gene_type:complete
MYVMSNDMKALMAELEHIDNDAQDYEIVQAIEEHLGYFRENIEAKAASICEVIAELKGEAAKRQAELERLKRTAAAKSRAAERLRSYILMCMKITDIKHIKAGNFDVSRRRNNGPVSLQIDGDDIPDKYVIKEVRTKYDLKMLQEDIKKGVEVPGVQACERGEHIRIN